MSKQNKKKLISLAILIVLAIIAAALGLNDSPADVTDPTDTTGIIQTDPTGESLSTDETDPSDPTQTTAPELYLDPDGSYNSPEDVALYIHLYGYLPRNYVTKSYASDVLGCSTSRVEDYWPDGAIGGDTFGNREGLLPSKAGRTWTECDVNTWGKYSRGAERIVFSNDGLVYYTKDHYASFELLYGDPDA